MRAQVSHLVAQGSMLEERYVREIYKQINGPLYSHPQREDIFVIGSLCLVMVILSPANVSRSAAGRKVV